MKRMIRKTKKMLIIMGTLIMITAFAIAGTLLFYANIQTNMNVGNILTIDGQPAENTIITNDINGYANTTYNNTYEMTVNKNATIYFNIDQSPEITTTILNEDTPISQIDMLVGTTYYIEIQYYIHNDATSGNYYSNITINPAP